MKTFVLLRVAAALSLVQGLAHGCMHVMYAPRHGPDEVALVAAMQSHHFSFGGFDRTYWDFYFGYGLFVAFGCLVQAGLLCQLSALAKTEPARLRGTIWVFLLANLGYATLVGTYFFLRPVAFDLVIAACLVLALVSAGTKSSAGQTATAAPLARPAIP